MTLRRGLLRTGMVGTRLAEPVAALHCRVDRVG